jgi:hypothetical protein
MNTASPNEQQDLTEILSIAQEGETKLKEMSDHATIIAEKWRIRTLTSEANTVETDSAHTQTA